jgi:hypothetical protein
MPYFFIRARALACQKEIHLESLFFHGESYILPAIWGPSRMAKQIFDFINVIPFIPFQSRRNSVKIFSKNRKIPALGGVPPDFTRGIYAVETFVSEAFSEWKLFPIMVEIKSKGILENYNQ